jgi:hypothetical protein
VQGSTAGTSVKARTCLTVSSHHQLALSSITQLTALAKYQTQSLGLSLSSLYFNVQYILAMAVLKIILTLVIAVVSWPILNLLKHYIEARSVGLPIAISPIGYTNLIVILYQKSLAPFIKSLPFGLGDWIVYSGFGSIFANRHRLHEKHGPAYLVVTPNEVLFYVDDAELVEEILGKRKDIIKSDAINQALNLFGTNVVSNNGDDWARHRRITTPPFNERNSNNIWKVSLAQATGSKCCSLLVSFLRPLW